MIARLAASALAAALALVLAPAAQARVPRWFMGADWDGPVAHAKPATQRSEMSRIAASGVETIRLTFLWAGEQPYGPGSTSFQETDPVVLMAASHGLSVLPVVIETPAWARDSSNPYSPPRDPNEYAAYLTALIDRYGPHGTFWSEHPNVPRLPIRAWQIWNEPDLPGWWDSGGGDWASSYVALLRAATLAARRADPGAQIVLGALTNYSWRDLQRLYAAGAGPYFDIDALDPYTQTPRNVIDIVDRARTVMRRAGDARKPIWITEFGLPASLHRVRSTSALQATDDGMAAFLGKTYLKLARDARRYRIERAYWYTWASSYAGRRPIQLWNYAGLFAWRHGRPHPMTAYRSFLETARRLEGCRRARAACARRR